jgi:hypothetical protein
MLKAPLCPPGTDPAAWDSLMRVARCVDARLTGALPDGEYLPDMGEDVFQEVACYPLLDGARNTARICRPNQRLRLAAQDVCFQPVVQVQSKLFLSVAGIPPAH